jgi:hypothetical protein
MTAPPSRQVSAIVPPLGSDAVWAAGWTPAEARLAVDQWKRGTFRWGWQLSLDVTGYPPIRAALEQRLATPSALPWTVEGGTRAPGRLETEAAKLLYEEHLARLLRSTLRDLALCNIAVWHHPLTVNDETLRAEVMPYLPIAPEGMVTEGGPAWGVPVGGVLRWPLSAVGWTAYPIRGIVGYYAIAQGNRWIQLPRPGTTVGEWTVVGEGDMPHVDAPICSLDMSFTAGMLAMRARSNLGVSAGRASPIGTMPEDVPVHTTDANGAQVQGPGEDAAATLAALGVEQQGALFPHGFELDKFELTTTGAAEYFSTDLRDSILMVALAILGHGGALAKTDAQYQSQEGREVDVPEALTRRDVRAIERAANGLFAMLAEINSGLPAARAPTLQGHLPDADQADRIKVEQAQAQAEAEKLQAYHAAVFAERSNGLAIDQERANAIAAKCGVDAPTLPPGGLPPVQPAETPTSDDEEAPLRAALGGLDAAVADHDDLPDDDDDGEDGAASPTPVESVAAALARLDAVLGAMG